MKGPKGKIFIYILGILFLTYFVVDVIHFFAFRISPHYTSFTEAYYESIFISIVKWIFCLSSLLGLYMDKRNINSSFLLLSISAIGIIVLFIIRGQLTYLLIGSVVMKFGILEISAVLSFIYSLLFLVRKYLIKPITIIITYSTAILLFVFLFQLIPMFEKGIVNL